MLIGLSVSACILVLFVVSVIRARSNSARAAAIYQLQQIDAAVKKWELEKAQTTNSASVSTNR